MSKANTFETDLLALLFNNANMSLVGDATGLRGSTVVGSLYLSLHTADPTDTGTQATSEIAYTSYARKAVARTAGEFSVSGNAVSLVNAQDFPEGTGGSGTATHWGLGTDASGAGKLIYRAALTTPIVCGTGVAPRIKPGVLATED